MAINKLKDRLIETLPSGPKGRPKVYADGGGLYLIVRGKSRSYGFRATLNGRQLPMMYLGSTKKKSLATARKERDRNNELVAEGKDPRAVKVAEKVQQDIGPPPTVTRLLNRYFETKIEPERQFDTKDKRLERINKARRFLDQIRDAMGKMPVSEVKVETILNTLGLEELSKISPPSSWELRRHLKRAFSMAEALGWRDGCDPRNPASDDLLNAILTNGYHKREPRAALDYKDAPRFVAEVKARTNHGLGKADQPLSPAPALLFLVYTGVRTQEVRDARWREIDWENLLWNVPSDHRKAGYKKNKVRAVPISKPMLKVLKTMKERYPDATKDDLIFPGKARFGGLGRGVILGFIKNTLKWDIPITVHGFRSTLRAWARAQRPPYLEMFVSAQFDHLGKSSDDDSWVRPSVAAVHYGDADRPGMTDPTIEGPGARREMIERYDAYLDPIN